MRSRLYRPCDGGTVLSGHGRKSSCVLLLLAVFLLISCDRVSAGLSASAAQEQPLDTRSYVPTTEYIANPYMGLAVWADADPEELRQEISLVYVDVTWKELEPERGQFDFDALESRCQFALWKEKGLHAIFRLVLDEPSEEAHRDIPDWLYAITGDGTEYDISYGRGYCPNYENETLISEHARVIEALSERYGKDDFVTFVELGSIGHWGEFHIHEDAGKMPSSEVCAAYYQPYVTYFSGKKLMLRRPYAFAAGTGPGLYNDSACLQESTEEWLKWIETGDDSQAAEKGQEVIAMPEAWETAPIGGEISSQYSTAEQYRLVTTEAGRVRDLFARSHTSWIGPNSFAGLDTTTFAAMKSGFDEVMQRVGYRLYVRQVDLYEDRIQVTFANDGAAPFYFDWDTVFRLCASDGTVYEITPDFDICSVLPGQDQTVTIPFSGQIESLYVMVCSKDRSEVLQLCSEEELLGAYRKIY